MKSDTETNDSRHADNMPENFAAAAAAEYFRLFSPAFCVLDEKGNILRSNSNFRKVFAQKKNSLTFDNIMNLLTPKSIPTMKKLLKEPDGKTAKLKAHNVHEEKLYLKVCISELSVSGKLFIAFFENISKIKRLQNKQKKQEKLLIQQSKMAAMGEMLGVIAHQWKQPLNTLAIIAQTIGDDFDHGELNADSVEEHIDAINSQILFMSTTVDDFRRFFIPQKTPHKFRIKDSVEEIISIIDPQLKTCNITVCLTSENDSAETIGYRNELKQVILNLIVNAKDAITHRREKDEKFRTEKGIIEIKISSMANICTISIGDNGTGISSGVMKKLFKPYFTTKNDNGTGIGLYLSKTIVEDKMHGTLSVENSATGAVFTVSLPLT
ncbi:HAMP domain-containing histidine kinase [Geovibrio thiophilus]|uniref:histidine kinase n=1 Tax=Geovibrio thiophilus TaxID=139438 RepID=A0A3R5Y8B9_9BACT|nr:HAMP domain-containing sensor histidine kinase [Geovibrio thiophilus]QAR34117.1 HAMP domain-containing histidine kinase [Geovibrio thiophilus]